KGVPVLKESFNFAQKGSRQAEIVGHACLGAVMNTPAPEMFRFSGYTLDVVRGCLQHAEREIELRPKSFEVLRCLVEKAGHLVTKDELVKAVWPNVVVSDESLMQCVSEVRRAIGDSDQTIIKNVPRRGYRFTAPVARLPIDPAVRSSIEPTQLDARG